MILEISRLINQYGNPPSILGQQGYGVKESYLMMGKLPFCIAQVMEMEVNLDTKMVVYVIFCSKMVVYVIKGSIYVEMAHTLLK